MPYSTSSCSRVAKPMVQPTWVESQSQAVPIVLHGLLWGLRMRLAGTQIIIIEQPVHRHMMEYCTAMKKTIYGGMKSPALSSQILCWVKEVTCRQKHTKACPTYILCKWTSKNGRTNLWSYLWGRRGSINQYICKNSWSCNTSHQCTGLYVNYTSEETVLWKTQCAKSFPPVFAWVAPCHSGHPLNVTSSERHSLTPLPFQSNLI